MREAERVMPFKNLTHKIENLTPTQDSPSLRNFSQTTEHLVLLTERGFTHAGSISLYHSSMYSGELPNNPGKQGRPGVASSFYDL